ncbi:hypothetical protein BHS07_24650 [Myxococcus xanthus]|nr:hypothetical protein BHS07_24650 [Myxococcus xanthus]
MATRIPHLDEIPHQAILPLAMLVAEGECNAAKLVHRVEIDESKAERYLEALCDFGFVEKTLGGYKSTRTGEQAFEAIGNRMVERELFEIGRRLEELKNLRRLMEATSTR